MAKTIKFNGRELTAKEFIKLANDNVKSATRMIHNIFGFDFNGYLHCGLINGKFTINSIYDACGIADFDRNNWKAVLLIRKTGDYNSYYNTFRLVSFTPCNFNVEFEKIWEYNPNRNNKEIETFFRKSDFDEWRKSGETETLFILQRKEVLKPCKNISDLDVETTRFLVSHSSRDDAECKPIGYNGYQTVSIAWRSRYFRYSGDEKYSINDCMDKSGYLIARKRNDLARRAGMRHRENEKKKVAASDFSGYVETLRAKLETVRKATANLLLFRNDAASVKKIADILNHWRGLASVYSDFERFADHAKNKDFSSIEKCMTVYNSILSSAEKIEQKITDFDKTETAIV